MTRTLPNQPGQPRVHAQRSAWFGFVVFISSACLLVLEIVAGRLLAPYIGVSLYTWTSVIGVILAGLSLGNWLGGRWADTGAGELAAGITLGLSALFTLAVLAILMLAAPGLQARSFSLLSASFIYVSILFFVPAMLLGVITPLLTTLVLRIDERAGHVVGRMHALAALGSIVGTFVTGYWLVQAFGTRRIVLGTAMVLLLLALPFFVKRWRLFAVIAGGVVVTGFIAQQLQGLANPCTQESRYYCIRVVDAEIETQGVAKSLVLDHMTHSTNHEQNPELLLVPYMHVMDELLKIYFEETRLQTLRLFFGGGGAYTHPRAVKSFLPESSITVAEIDPVVTTTVETQMFVNTDSMRIFHEDARLVLNQLKDDRFDAIVTDVFHDLAVPYHLTTHEYAQLVKSRLSKEGLYLLNIVDVFPDPRLVKAFIKTLQQEFMYVDVWMEPPPSETTRLTYVVSASDRDVFPDILVAQTGIERVWFKATEPIVTTGTTMESITTLSDDYAPVESLVSRLFTTEAGL